METCSFTGCVRHVSTSGLCASHYKQQQRGRTLTPIAGRGGKGKPRAHRGPPAPVLIHIRRTVYDRLREVARDNAEGVDVTADRLLATALGLA